MTELLVILMCAQDIECSQLTKAYMSQNSAIAKNIKIKTKKAKELMGRDAAFTLALLYTGVAKSSIKLRLPADLILQVGGDRVELEYRWDF